MKTEIEIRKEIEEVVKGYKHVLTCGPATVFINAPRALMQHFAQTRLDALYWVLGGKRPQFKCDDTSKTDH